MVILVTILHVIVCVFLAVVVLLQSGKAADLAGAFGGMGSQTVFGPRGSATVLSRATTLAAALFMLTSMTLSVMSTRNGKASPAIFQKTIPGAASTPSKGTAPAAPSQSIPVQIPAAPAQSGQGQSPAQGQTKK